MRILISNDDGIQSKGIHALAEVFSKEHEVIVVAPDSERSACSHALSSMFSVTYKKEESYPFNAYSCSGTPADCIKLAVMHLMDRPPELVLSGINNGRNLGSDVIYSGTVSAAFEGIYLGIPSIAVSTSYGASYSQLLEIAGFVAGNLKKLLGLKLPITSALNINYPLNRTLLGAKITPLGMHLYDDGFYPVNDGYRLQGNPLPLKDEDKDCDIHWYSEGYITITPVQNDRNDHLTLKRVKGEFKGEIKGESKSEFEGDAK